jgi:pimeloyl-ACP methyl ester carboxylesterase
MGATADSPRARPSPPTCGRRRRDPRSGRVRWASEAISEFAAETDVRWTTAWCAAYSRKMRETMVAVGGENLRMFEAGSGRPVLYLHGAGGLAWYPLLELLSQRHHVMAPEHPGFGRGELPDWLTNIGDLAYFYLDALAAMGLEGVHLVGHSLGGWTASEIAIRNTQRLKTLSLLAPAGVEARDEPYGDIFLWSPEEHARNSFFEQRFADERIRALPDADIDATLRNQAAAARLAWAPRLHNPRLAHWLHRIDVPTLVVWGEEDRICPFSCHRTFVESIAGAALFALPRSGHALHTERPEEVAARLQDFFAAPPGPAGRP